MFPFPLVPPALITAANFVAATVDTTDTTNYTFASQTLYESMLVCAGRMGAATQGVSSLTVGGVGATLVVAQLNPDNEVYSSIWMVSGVTPGSGSIVVNGSAASTKCSIATYETTNRAATAHHTASAGFASGGADPSASLNIPSGGFAVGYALEINESVTWTWTGLSTEDVDATIEGASTHTAAHQNSMTVETGRTITAARSATTNKGSLVTCSFAPA